MIKKKEINSFGRKLEEMLKDANIDPNTMILLETAMSFSHGVGYFEKEFEEKGDPYSAYTILEKYKKIKRLIR